jgi:UDP-galactopyranose mutase
MELGDVDAVVVGAGLFGLTIAERIANGLGRPVALIDRRTTLGGNAASQVDGDSGIEVHSYGSHIFHTSNPAVIAYTARFTKFNDYRHTVRADHRGKLYPMPINLVTINRFFGLDLDPDQAREFLREQGARSGARVVDNLEDKAISMVGPDLYEAFIRGYTLKQWQTDPRQLSPAIITRLPVRFTDRDDYFDDDVQGVPRDGYQRWFERMVVGNDLIDLRLATDFADIRGELRPDQLVVYSGPIDTYFDHCLGALSWRTLDLVTERLEVGNHQGCAVVNYADVEVPFTRVHEFRHLHPERDGSRHSRDRTVVMHEFSRRAEMGDEPYYPVRTELDIRRLAGYQQLARQERATVFGGRLGSYRYLDMHMAIASALTVFENNVRLWFA